MLLYRGKEYELRICVDVRRRRPRVELDQNQLVVYAPTDRSEVIYKALENWYGKMAHMILPARVLYYQRVTGGTVNCIRIKDQKTRWGSCSSKRNLNFNWRLVMAPEAVLDYVVVHELCHLTHMNHGKEFWAMVAEVMPEYKQWRKWLRDNGQCLFDMLK